MIINHNLSAVHAHRSLKFIQWDVDKSMQKLSSGQRINRAGDDPSGLAVSEKMRSQIQGLRQAERNTEDGLSFLQTAEGYMAQISNIVQRIRVLAVQAANGIYSNSDRKMIQVEVSQLVDEVNRIGSQAEFNKMRIFTGDFAANGKSKMLIHFGPNANQNGRITVQALNADTLKLKGVSMSTATKANETIGKADEALMILMRQRSTLGAFQNRLEHTARGLMNAYENVQASESRIRDTDMAEEMVNLTTKQILSQTAVAMMAQAGVRPQGVLQLLK
jgi:flagellin